MTGRHVDVTNEVRDPIESPETVLIVEVPDAEPLVGELRQRHDPVASRGIPAHVTALFPFRTTIDAESLATVAGIAAATPVRSIRFERLDEFPGVLWLRPVPDQPFRDLTARLVAAFPDCPPYGGRFPDSQPHLTVAQFDASEPNASLRAEVNRAIEPRLPLECTLDRLSLFTSNGSRWQRKIEFPFGDPDR